MQVTNSTATANITPNSLVTGTTTVNATSVALGANVLISTTNVSFGNSTVNTQINSTSIAVAGTLTVLANVNVDSGDLFVDTVNHRVGISNSAPDTNLTVTGNANVSGNVTIGGQLTVAGNITSVGTQVVTGDIVPVSNGYNLGNTTSRWNLFAANVDISQLLTVTNAASFSNTVTMGGSLLTVGNSTVNTQINSTVGVISTLNSLVGINVNANVSLTNTGIKIGNTIANVLANSILLQVTNATSGTNTTPAGFFIGNSTVNSLGIYVGSNTVANVTIVAGKSVGVNTTAPSVALTIVSNDAIQLPVGNTSQRPTGNTGLFRYNGDSNTVEMYANGNWFRLSKAIGETAIGGSPIVEDTATNLLLNTANVLVGSWTNTTMTVVANTQMEDPFGGLGSYTITPTVTSVTLLQQSVAVANDLTYYTDSIYLNQNCTSVNTRIQILFSNSTANVANATIELNAQTGIVYLTSGTVTNYNVENLYNGWFRVSVIGENTNTTANTATFAICPDITTNKRFAVIYGPQLETGNTGPTSFISTTTVAKTRPAGKLNISTIPLGTTLADDGSGRITISGVAAVNAASIFLGNSTANLIANSINLTVTNSTSNVVVTPISIFLGNSTANAFVNSIFAQVTNSTATANITPNALTIGTSTVNSTVISEGANVLITTSTITVGNSTVNTFANSSVVNTGTLNLITAANVGANVNLSTTTLSVGNSIANLIANSIDITLANATANVIITPVSIAIGNSVANVFANSIIMQVTNSTATANITPNSLVIGTTTVNSTVISEGANVLITTSTLTIGNSTVNTFANSSVVNTGTINLITAANVGANVNLSTVALTIGNSTANAFVNSIFAQITNSTATANLVPNALTIGTSVVNSTVISEGANVLITTSTITVGNSIANHQTNSISVTIANATANLILTPVSIFLGNSIANTFANSILISVSNATAIANITPNSLVIGTSTVNATAIAEGANVLITTSTITVGNSIANLLANSIDLTIANATANLILTPVSLFTGNSVANAFVNSTIMQVTNSTATANITPNALTVGTSVVNTTAIAEGANVLITTSTLTIGNTTANLLANSIFAQITNSTSTSNVTPAGFFIGPSTVNSFGLYVGANTVANVTVLAGKVLGVNTTAPSVALTIVSNDAIQLPVGNNSQRPSSNTGLFRYNGDANTIEVYANSNWFLISTKINDTVIGGAPIVEDTATNLLLNTANTLVGSWTNTSMTVVANTTMEDPFGGVGAYTLTPTAFSDVQLTQSVSVANDLSYYTGSIYLNQNCTSVNTRIQILLSNSTANVANATIELNAQTGIVYLKSGTVINFNVENLYNGWFRVSTIGRNTNTTANTATFTIHPDITNSKLTAVVYGSQLETGNNGPTSFIATTATSKTRPAGKLNISTVPLNPVLVDDGSGRITVGNLVTLNVSGNSSITSNLILATTNSTQNVVYIGNSTTTVNTNIDGGALFVDAVHNRVGVNTTSPAVTLVVSSTDAILVPVGNTGNRPSGVNGYFRYSNELNAFEGYANGAWGNIGGGGSAPGGSNTYIQFNDSGALGGVAGLTFDKATNIVFIANTLNVGTTSILSTVALTIGNSTANIQMLLPLLYLQMVTK